MALSGVDFAPSHPLTGIYDYDVALYIRVGGDETMRVISWNMNKRQSGNWEWLLEELDPDIALVQEASPLPKHLNATIRNVKKNHRTVIYSKANDQECPKLHQDGVVTLTALTWIASSV